MMRLLINLVLLFILSSPAFATTWYVRDGGGTPAQCSGKTNAVYPGSGSGVACAFSHPAYVQGINTEGFYGTLAGVMASGDTEYINGNSDVSPGNQAQYLIGYGMPGSSGVCNTGGAYACLLDSPPAGTSSTPTSVIGTGTLQPQLYGTQGVAFIFPILNNYVTVQNLEITQHDSCTYVTIGASNPGYGGFPAWCGGTGGSYPYGTWAQYGLELEGSNITTSNLWVHNISESSIDFPGLVSNWSSTNDRFIAAGEYLDDGPNMTFGGTNTLTNDIWAFGGCVEKYPLPDPGNFKDLNNYINCTDQNAGGNALGGGLTMQYDGNAACGNWTITNSQFSFNLKSGIDFLHCNGTGQFNMYRSRVEGNTGETVKINMAGANIEESELLGDAPLWSNSNFLSILAPYSTSNVTWYPNICRGEAITLFAGVANAQINLVNDDISGNCGSLVETSVLGCTGCTCPGMAVNATNTKFLGGYNYVTNEGESVDLMYNGGDDGNGSGSCGTNAVPLNMNYDSCYNVETYNGVSCTSGTNMVTSDPLVLFEATTPIASTLGPTAYYSGTSLGDQFYLQSTSPLRGKATTSVTYTNGSSNDYNNVSVNSPPDIGAIQYGSLIPNSTGPTNGFCSLSDQCASNTCSSSGYCTGSCTANGGSCTSNSTCCSGICNSNICSASSCTGIGGACSTNTSCCSGICCSNLCALSCGGTKGINAQLSGQCSLIGTSGLL